MDFCDLITFNSMRPVAHQSLRGTLSLAMIITVRQQDADMQQRQNEIDIGEHGGALKRIQRIPMGCGAVVYRLAVEAGRDRAGQKAQHGQQPHAHTGLLLGQGAGNRVG
ncbi:hypothetical protein D3C73_1371750 [compost metagenome]